MKRIHASVDERLKKQRETASTEKEPSPSEIGRQTMDKTMRQPTPRESADDLADRIGIIGSSNG